MVNFNSTEKEERHYLTRNPFDPKLTREQAEEVKELKKKEWKEQTGRTLYYLRDIIGTGTFIPYQRSKDILIAKLVEEGEHTKDMSNATLDINEVIIPPEIEQMFYAWMENFDLDIIDTTVEYNKLVFDSEINQFVGKEEPIAFRHEAFAEFRRRLTIQRMAIDIKKFYVYKEEQRKEVFTKEESAKEIVDLINERYRAGNRRKLLLSIKSVNQFDTYSVRQIAAFMISAVNHIEVLNTDALSVTGQYGILPAVSQLCFDFSTGDKAWLDIKNKFPVGSEVYFSTKPTDYVKARVVKNRLTDEEGQDLYDKKNLSYEERHDFSTITLEHDIKGDNGEVVDTKEFELQRSFIIAREVLLFPVPIFEGGTGQGMPTSEELSRNIDKNEIRERKQKVISENDSFLLNSYGNESLHTDWLALYRNKYHRAYQQMGVEVPKIDLKEIIRGKQSPFIELFKKYNKHI